MTNSVTIGKVVVGGRRTHLVVVVEQRLHDDVVELEVEDGGDGLALGAQQRGPEAHGQVRRRHQVLVALRRHAARTHAHPYTPARAHTRTHTRTRTCPAAGTRPVRARGQRTKCYVGKARRMSVIQQIDDDVPMSPI